MGANRLEFTIAVKPFGAVAQKDAAKFTGELRASDSAVEKLKKSTIATTQAAKKNLDELTHASTRSTNALVSGFERAIGIVEKFNHRLEHGTKHAFEKVKESFKEAWPFAKGNLLATGFEKLFELPAKLFEAGSGDIRAKQRLRREFGGDAGFMKEISERVGRKAGLDDAASISALFAVGEAVSGTTAGTKFRGKKLTDAQAKKLRESTFGFGAQMFERVATITGAKGEEASQLGYLMANAGSGPEGMRGFVAALHLNKALSAQVLKANEKGKLHELLGAEGSKKFGVERGKVAGQGTVMDILLQRSGFTEEAAAEERKKFGFQIKSIGATFESALGDIGARALDRVTGGLAKGRTLAEKFQEALESDKGKKTIESIGNAIAWTTENAVKLATKIPEIIGFLEKHKTALGILAGGYAVASIAKPVLGALGSIRGATPMTPLYVSVTGGIPGIGGGGVGTLGKLGLVGAAGAGGYALGTYLDNKFHLSDKISGVNKIKAKDDSEFAKDDALRAVRREAVAGLPPELRDKYRAMIQKATPIGIDLDEAKRRVSDILGSDQFTKDVNSINVTSVLQLDGKTIATVVNQHNARQVQNSTGGIPH